MSVTLLTDQDIKNDVRAKFIARRIVANLSITNIQSEVTELMKYRNELDQLCSAIDPSYPALDRHLNDLEKQVDVILADQRRKLAVDFSNGYVDKLGIQNTAFFYLGFEAALRLLSSPPNLRLINNRMKHKRETSC